ncbi:uncharacterized protein LOC122575899, partial [Bombus pyrosoma]|uniref:uncharacterized protein LOC122575899 n=1 Tax=Bombus pyrosoma TaxID=396416 RepID=UPI001CB9D413
SDLFAYDPAKYSFCREKSIVNILKIGESGGIQFLSEIRKGVYSISIWPEYLRSDYDNLLDQLELAIPETSQWKNRRPNIGDFVFGQRVHGRWLRGYVTCVLPTLKIAMVDEAELESVNNLATCEKHLADMYAYSAICELTDATHAFEVDREFKFKVTGRTDNEKPDEFEILIHRENLQLKATVKPWIPMPEQLGVPCGDLNYETTVCITGYRNHLYIYVRPLDTLGLARYNFIMETVAKCAETSPFLKALSLGQSVLALSADGNYYRAYVTNLEEERAHVMYHDLGRGEYVDRKKLKIFPEFLKKLGYCMSKIRLHGIPKDIPPVMSIIEILDNLVENKVPLILTYGGVPSTEGVYLKYPDGETVNNMICKCLEPYRV